MYTKKPDPTTDLTLTRHPVRETHLLNLRIQPHWLTHDKAWLVGGVYLCVSDPTLRLVGAGVEREVLQDTEAQSLRRDHPSPTALISRDRNMVDRHGRLGCECHGLPLNGQPDKTRWWLLLRCSAMASLEIHRSLEQVMEPRVSRRR